MPLSNLLGEALEAEGTDYWDRERTVTSIWAFAVQFHSAGLSLRETVAILDLLDVDRPHGAVWNWTHRLVENQTDPPWSALQRVAVDETAIQIGTEWQWCYAAIDLDSIVILGLELFTHPESSRFFSLVAIFIFHSHANSTFRFSPEVETGALNA